MACEPCIRGHRSTKCNHADERLMVSVRKPGRPLSVCPHPPNNPCSCGNVTAAIPRAKKCGCGPKTNGKGPKASPTKKAFHAPANPASSAPRNRFDPSALDRIDPNQVNIYPAPIVWDGQGTQPPVGAMKMPLLAPGQNGSCNPYMLPPGIVPYATSQTDNAAIFTPAASPYQIPYQPRSQPGSSIYNEGPGGFGSYYGPGVDSPLSLMSLDLGGQPMPIGDSQQRQMPDGMNGLSSMLYQSAPNPASLPVSVPAPATSQSSAPKRSCCSGPPPETPTGSPKHTPNSSLNSITSHASTTNPASVSASTPMSASYSPQHVIMKTENIDGGLQSQPLSRVPSVQADVKPNGANGYQLNGHSQQMMLPPDAIGGQVPYSFDDHGTPTWYKYSPGYGTMAAPLQPSQWPEGLDVPQPASFEDEMRFGGPAMSVAFPLSAEAPSAESHMCDCGDSCECVGCVAHPYNNATQSTVQAAWTSMLDSPGSGRRSSIIPSAAIHSRTLSTNATTASGMPSSTALGSAPHYGTGNEASSPQPTQTPSDTSGAAEDQVSLSADDFFFVSYSVMGCSGEGLTCPCGDDCQCVGCTIHNNSPMAQESTG